MCEVFNFQNPNFGAQVKEYLPTKWQHLSETDSVFQYRLNIEYEKYLRGKIGFFVQLNENRTLLRRRPQSIQSVTPEFNTSGFNFNKTDAKEHLFYVNFDDIKVLFLINNSPLTVNHTLICPDVDKNCPQILKKVHIEFALKFLRAFDERCYRIGYNSPGALASVNHCHMHLLYINAKLYIEDTALIALTNSLYKIKDANIPGFCFISHSDNDITTAKDIYSVIQMFCDNNIPHNISFTWGVSSNNTEPVIRIYIFPRQHYFISKENCVFNVAFCELSGYVPVGTRDVYDSITEDFIFEHFNESLGDIGTIETKILELFE